MLKSSLRSVIIVLAASIVAYSPAEAKSAKFPLASYDNTGCRFKARSQDCPNRVMNQILAKGKGSIPILISQLTDSERTETPAEAQWSYTASGDIAYIVLVSLFTTPEGKFNLPDVPTWKNVIRGCNSNVEGCWRAYVSKYGRKQVQRAWLNAWKLHKDQISWDPIAKCFQVAGVETSRSKNRKE
jgi:hypothetical protein